MEKIITYFKDNPKVLITAGIILFAVICAGLIIILVKKKKRTKREEEKFFSEYVAQSTPQKPVEATKEEKKPAPAPQPEVKQVTQNKTAVAESKPAQSSEALNKEQTKEQTSTVQQPVKTQTEEEKPMTKTTSTEKKTKTPTKVQPEVKTAKAPAKPKQVKPSGKWIIYSYLDEKKTRYYTARLKASNGETLLDIESYTTLNGVKSGLDTIRKNIQAKNFIYKGDKNNNWNFRIYSANKMLLCLGEGYTSKLNCESAIASVKKFSESATVVDTTPEENVNNLEMRVSNLPVDIAETADNVVGKWVIKSITEDGKTWYKACLKASNGVVILNTESYASLSGMRSGIDTIKKNISANNFDIKEDKNGNWNFKLYNARKMLLCVGEGYTSRLNCESAISSVRRFSKNSVIVEGV